MAVLQTLKSVSSAGNANVHATFAGPVAQHSTVVVVGENSGRNAPQTMNAPTDSSGNTYHTAVSEGAAGPTFTSAIWYAFDVPASASLQVSLSTPGFNCCGLTVFDNIAYLAYVLDPATGNVDPLDVVVPATQSVTGTTDWLCPTSATTTSARDVVIGTVVSVSVATAVLGPGSGWNSNGALLDGHAIFGNVFYAESQPTTSAGTFAADFTGSLNAIAGNQIWMSLAAFASVPAAPPATPAALLLPYMTYRFTPASSWPQIGYLVSGGVRWFPA